VVGACPVCCPPLRWVLSPCAGAPLRCCGPDRDHCYDRREATALDASIRSLYGDTRGAATHSPMGRVSGGLGRRTPSSRARRRRSASRAVVQQPVQPQPQLRYQHQLSDICLEEIGFWYAGRNQLYKKPVIRSLSERKKKNISQIYKKPVIRFLLEEENESRTQKYKRTSRSLVVQYDICM